jgi:hypothetical protein
VNTNGLAKHYGKLTPWERVPLLVAAGARGDEAEADRLARSAPTRLFEVPDYHGLCEGLLLLAGAHLIVQLDLAVSIGAGSALLAQQLRFPKEQEVKDREGWRQRLQLAAYRFVVNADAWKLLCTGLNIDAEALLGHLPGYEKVKRMEESVRQVAFTPVEALTFLRQTSDEAEKAAGKTPPEDRKCRIDTAEDRAREMRAFLTSRLSRPPSP